MPLVAMNIRFRTIFFSLNIMTHVSHVFPMVLSFDENGDCDLHLNINN